MNDHSTPSVSKRETQGRSAAKSPEAGETLRRWPMDMPRAEEVALRLSIIVPVYNERHLVRASLTRVLRLSHPLIAELQVVVVDDGSSDGSIEVVEEVAASDPRIKFIKHERNQGKGAAIRTGIRHVSGDVVVIHDADLEYDPGDIPTLLVPFVTEGADAVYGSRYLSAPYRRTLMFRHSMVNRALTTLSNLLTDLDLSDMETCYKAVRTELLRSIPIRSNDFRFEFEITSKLAKRKARIFEVPIRYLPRSYEEGKKIRVRDGIRTLGAMAHFWFVDDIYQKDEYGSHILSELERARRFNIWMADALRPYLGDRVLEIGSGVGTLTNQFIPRSLYLASDINPNYLYYLRSYSIGKPYLNVRKIDATNAEDFKGLDGKFDTAVMVNVLEHVDDAGQTVRNLHGALSQGGRAIILVPQGQKLFGTLDEALEHRLRYSPEQLREVMESNGFEVETMFDFNRFSVPGWWLNGKVMRKKTFSRFQLKVVNAAVPFLKRVDAKLPWMGQSLIVVAKKK